MTDTPRGQALDPEYEKTVASFLSHQDVRSMQGFRHHDRTALTHSIAVSTTAYAIARRLRMDSRSVARGALLHDFFLYDRRAERTEHHLKNHARIALQNANARFDLNPIEKDIILCHMWPIGRPFYSYRESLLVSLVDKAVSAREVAMMAAQGIAAMTSGILTTLRLRLASVMD